MYDHLPFVDSRLVDIELLFSKDDTLHKLILDGSYRPDEIDFHRQYFITYHEILNKEEELIERLKGTFIFEDHNQNMLLDMTVASYEPPLTLYLYTQNYPGG